MNWPNDADGDVLRRLEKDGFDFSKEVSIDFNIDFDHWPLADEEKKQVLKMHPECEFIDPSKEDINEGLNIGYAQFNVHGKLTYKLVVNIQHNVTKEMSKIGGWCESWGAWNE